VNAIELIAALKGADGETGLELIERLQCGQIDCSVLPTGKENAVLQAQIWAQEARTQKGIVEEIGKLVGCANDWEMVGAVKAALSANGGEAVPLAGIVQVASTCFKQVLPWDEAKRQHASILSASDSLGSPGDDAELIPLYPAPPSFAVPEAVTDSMVMRGAEWLHDHGLSIDGDPASATDQMQEIAEGLFSAMLTAAPQPDHSGYTSEVADDLPGMWDQSDFSGGETDVLPPKHHTLKTDPAVYDRSAMGRKPWEIRLNDRDYQVGDTVTLQETKHSGAEMQQGAPLEFTGNEITGQITYVLRGPKYGLADGWCVFSVEPDHIADAGKVVPSDWEGWACHKAGKMPRLYGEKSIAEVNCDTENGERLVFLSAAPSVPENEVKARGLEEYADQLDVVFANAQEAGATDCPAWHAGQFAKDARKQAARLRTAGDEGEGV
jgi:hypothetical protein